MKYCLSAFSYSGAPARTLILLMSLYSMLSFSPSAEAARSGAVIGFVGKCLDVRGAGNFNGVPVQIWDCVNGNGQVPQQNWTLNDRGEIRVFGNKCLDVRGPSTNNGTTVQIWDCVGVSNQQWRLESGRLRGYGNKCLDVRGANPNNGTPVQIWDCVDVTNQIWRIGNPRDNSTWSLVMDPAAVGVCGGVDAFLLTGLAPGVEACAWYHLETGDAAIVTSGQFMALGIGLSGGATGAIAYSNVSRLQDLGGHSRCWSGGGGYVISIQFNTCEGLYSLSNWVTAEPSYQRVAIAAVGPGTGGSVSRLATHSAVPSFTNGGGIPYADDFYRLAIKEFVCTVHVSC